ncbi:MAG TPA: ankyrin repeat domain-containing protein, partial [Blastocatellia bacterium]|nr:ankyrin repeat domain-containing protein [Blastocatellia bacterium]
ADGFMPEPIYLNVGLIRYNKRRPLHYDARFRVGINLYRIRGPKDYVAPSQPMTNKIDRFGMTAMMRAAIIGDVFQVKRLISAGADPNRKAAGGMTALLLAAKFGHADVVKELANNGADVNAANDHGATVCILRLCSARLMSLLRFWKEEPIFMQKTSMGNSLELAKFGEEGVMEINSRPYNKITEMLRRAESERVAK